jgi:hypothetical protein
MKPTIGRIVIYTLYDGFEPCPAVIVRVWSDTCVNLKVFIDGPQDMWVTSVCEGTGPRSWHWPAKV